MLRRDFLKAATLTSAGLMIPTSFERLATAAENQSPSFRFVHLTDIHVQPERGGAAGMTKCLQAVETLDPKPDFILTGGDLIYDAGKEYTRGTELFELYKQIIADHTGLPVYHCVGNHDVYGWGREEELDTKNSLFGKGLMSDQLELPKTYFAFDHKGWRFYVLDSIQPTTGKPYKYTAGLDEEQRAWLEADLAAKPKETPAVVVTHIPVLTVTSLRKRPEMLGEDFYLTGASGMFASSLEMGLLFDKYNVRLALSGHLHDIDRIERGNVTYICDGAVCGGWWYGPNVDSGYETQEGFGVIDVNADGSFEHHYFDYGWEAEQTTKG